MRAFIVGVIRRDIPASPDKGFNNPYKGYTLYCLSENPEYSLEGVSVETLRISDTMLGGFPAPRPGSWVVYEYNNRGRIGAINGFEYIDGHPYETLINISCIEDLINVFI